MSTATTRLGLVMETDLENYSVETVNANSAKVDDAVGFLECTSTTRPSVPWNGQSIRESDTGSLFVSNGSAPASGSWLPIWGANGPVVVGAVGVNAPLRAQTTSTLVNNRLIDARKVGETYPGWQVDFDGRQQWGPGGSTVPDTWLYRSAAATLTTGGALIVSGVLTATGGSNRVARPYLHAYQASTQSLVAFTAAPITMTAEVLDSVSGHSTVTNTSRFTPNVAGYYRCTGMVVVDPTYTGDLTAQFRKNGSSASNGPYGYARGAATSFGGQCAFAQATFQCNGSTDYIELYGNVGAGTTTFQSTSAGLHVNSHMIIEWIAA